MFEMRILIVLIVLIICTISDIRSREINITILIPGLILLLIMGGKVYFAGVTPGVIILIISKLISGIGEGDAYLFIFVGVMVGLDWVLDIVFISFIVSGVYALIMKATKKYGNDYSYAFVPFVLTGFVMSCLLRLCK